MPGGGGEARIGEARQPIGQDEFFGQTQQKYLEPGGQARAPCQQRLQIRQLRENMAGPDDGPGDQMRKKGDETGIFQERDRPGSRRARVSTRYMICWKVKKLMPSGSRIPPKGAASPSIAAKKLAYLKKPSSARLNASPATSQARRRTATRFAEPEIYENRGDEQRYENRLPPGVKYQAAA